MRITWMLDSSLKRARRKIEDWDSSPEEIRDLLRLSQTIAMVVLLIMGVTFAAGAALFPITVRSVVDADTQKVLETTFIIQESSPWLIPSVFLMAVGLGTFLWGTAYTWMLERRYRKHHEARRKQTARSGV